MPDPSAGSAVRTGGTGPAAGGGPGRAFRALALVVVVGAVAVRAALLGRQSYWVDELFSVSQSSGSFRRMLELGATEVHTPLHAALLWAWIRLGGTDEAWTRVPSLLAAVAAVVVTHRGTRGLGLSEHVRWALTVATAAGGTSLVYSLETRNYALLLLGAVGLTVTTLSAAPAAVQGRPVARGTVLAWTGWSLLAATAHLFGAVLTLAAAAVLGTLTTVRRPGSRGRPILVWGLLAAIGCSLQVGWLVAGLGRPGFASGTAWIQAPRPDDLRDLLTTTFAAGGLAAHPDGFAWTSSAGVLIAAGVCLIAAVAGHRARRRSGSAPSGPATPSGPAAPVGPAAGSRPEGPAATVLLAVAALTVTGVFGLSQWRHLWTLRNLVVVVPALTWGVICLAAASAGTAAGRRVVATAAVGLSGAGLIPLAADLSRPYKTDFRGLFVYLADVRRTSPEAELVFVGRGPPLGWGPVDGPLRAVAGPGPGRDVAPRGMAPRGVAPVAVASARSVVRTSGTQVIVLYRGAADRRPGPAAAALAVRLDPVHCRVVRLTGLGVVRCG